MRKLLWLALFLVACPSEPKNPEPNEGPFLVFFRPWVKGNNEAPAPVSTAAQISKVAQEVFSGPTVMFDEAALSKAKKYEPCADLPCAADVARTVGATWFITGQLSAFPPEHCFVFFSARSFETGAEIIGYNPEEVETTNISSSRADFSLKSQNLKKCNDPAFYEEVRKTLRKMSEDPALRRGLTQTSKPE